LHRLSALKIEHQSITRNDNESERNAMDTLKIILLSALLTSTSLLAQVKRSSSSFPPYMRSGFDFATFTRFDTPSPEKSDIYQSNGFMALQENGFGGQTIIIPVAGPPAPTNGSERLRALQIDAPVFTDHSGRTFDFSDSPAKRNMTYFADRTVYRAAFDDGPQVTLTVYPVYGKPVAVLRARIDKSDGPVSMTIKVHGDGFQPLSNEHQLQVSYGSPKWPYRLLLAGAPRAALQNNGFRWTLNAGQDAALLIALGGRQQEASVNLSELQASPDLFDSETHRDWNQYLASAPLVAPVQPVHFIIGTTGQHESISPRDLVRSELWGWRGVLNTTCQVNYLPACPMTIADWNVFMGMWSNDGIAETLALMATDRTDLAHAAILNWFRYSVNAEGDGTLAWTIFPSGVNTFAATEPVCKTQGVTVQGSLVGEYVRLTGDSGILNEKPGGTAGNRTLWQALLAYRHNVMRVRDPARDNLIEWLHIYETGWDDKDSPFVDLHGDPTAAMNSQIFNLWSLQEMAWLARIQGDDPTPWEHEFDLAKAAVQSKLWDPATQRYWDLDEKTGKRWTKGANLDAFYELYYETDPTRIAAMVKRLNNPARFNGPMLPTLAFDTPHWGGYWRGPAWPRIFGYVAMGLARSGHPKEGFNWLARGIAANLGPMLPEHLNPKFYPPGKYAEGDVRIMGYDALDDMLFPDVAGLRTWAGQDLTVAPEAALGKVYIRNQKWMGDRYDAIFNPGHASLLWRNGCAMKPLPDNEVWRAQKHGESVVFEPVKAP
jgi:Mannosylglycerate hydrolase MGH1-like glycoside hydrolase domain